MGSANEEASGRPAAGRIRLRSAYRAFLELIEDPSRTELVFRISEALAGRQPQRLLRRVRRAPGGARLLGRRPIFDTSTVDLAELERLPAGSFGREFAVWMREHRLAPGLIERDPGTDDPELAYLGRRLTQVHDLWHVLSGYNRDPVGELGVLSFTVGQTGSRGIAFIVGMVILRSLREHWATERRPWSPLLPWLWRAYRAGRRAAFLPPLPLEDLLALPLSTVRASLGIEPLCQAFGPDTLPPIAAPVAV